MVRCAFAIFTVLKYGCFLHWLYQIRDESRYVSWERRTGHLLDECLQNQASLTYYLLDLADEARHLINSVVDISTIYSENSITFSGVKRREIRPCWTMASIVCGLAASSGT